MARRGHVVVPRELTRTHASTHVARWINQAKYTGPTGIVGLGVKIKGVYETQWATQSLKIVSLYIGDNLS